MKGRRELIEKRVDFDLRIVDEMFELLSKKDDTALMRDEDMKVSFFMEKRGDVCIFTARPEFCEKPGRLAPGCRQNLYQVYVCGGFVFGVRLYGWWHNYARVLLKDVGWVSVSLDAAESILSMSEQRQLDRHSEIYASVVMEDFRKQDGLPEPFMEFDEERY